MGDFGANVGLLISSKGFQSGAYQAAENTNLRLMDWIEFQQAFCERWYKNYFMPTLSQINEPLVDYTEPINTRIFRKADLLDDALQNKFRNLREIYSPLASTALFFYAQWYQPPFNYKFTLPELPLKGYAGKRVSEIQQLPEEILNAISYHDLLKLFERYIMEALYRFDEIFGERA